MERLQRLAFKYAHLPTGAHCITVTSCRLLEREFLRVVIKVVQKLRMGRHVVP
jgi:hypothetical protein